MYGPTVTVPAVGPLKLSRESDVTYGMWSA